MLDICMRHAFKFVLMNRDRTANLLAAFSVMAAMAATEAAAEAVGDGVPGAAALTTLRQYPGMSIYKLSETLGLTHSATVRVVDRLQDQSFVTRHPGADRRLVCVQLTKAGKQAADRARDARLAATNRLIDALTDAQVESLRALLNRIVDGLAINRVTANYICRLCDEQVCGGDCPVDRAACRSAAQPSV